MAEALKQVEEYFDGSQTAPAFDPSHLAPSKGPNVDADFTEDLYDQPARVNRQSHRWNLLEIAWLCISVVVTLVICGMIIANQMDIREKELSMNHLEKQIQNYQILSDELRAEIALMYNYQDIKKAAEDAGMRIDKARIGNLLR